MSDFADELLAAPNGVLLSAWLEAEHRPDRDVWHRVEGSSSDAVERAVAAVGQMTVGQLLTRVVKAATELGGPWTSGAIGNLTDAYSHAPERRPIAEAVAERFFDDLTGAPDLDGQEVWLCGHRTSGPRPCFVNYDHVYGNGQFTWAAFRTSSAHPADSSIDFSVSTDGTCELNTRWRLPVRDQVRVWRVNRPDDWVRLVTSYPREVTEEHDNWELPGPNQRMDWAAGTSELERVSDGRAARTTIGGHVLPDWAAIATDFDGVHLSWAGYLTTEGRVTDIDGAVTMLRYWDGEQTHWLSDVFGTPELLGAPSHLGDVGIDPVRRTQDRRVIESMLGRDL